MITGAFTQVAQRTEQGAHRIHVDDDGRFGAPGTEDWMAFFRDSEDNLAGLVERRPPA